MDYTKTFGLLVTIGGAAWGTVKYLIPFIKGLQARGILTNANWRVLVGVLEALQEASEGSPAGQFPKGREQVDATATAVAKAAGVDAGAVKLVANLANGVSHADVTTASGKREVAKALLASYGPSIIEKLRKK